MRSFEISSYAGGYNMLGLAVDPTTDHVFLTGQGPGNDLWELGWDGAVVYSTIMEKGGVTYGDPSSLAMTNTGHLLVSRPIYANENPIGSNTVEMSRDGKTILSAFTDYCYTFGGPGMSYNSITGNLLLSSFRDRMVYEVSTSGVLIDCFATRSTPGDIAFDRASNTILVMYSQNMRGIIDEYQREDFHAYSPINSYGLECIGITGDPLGFDINPATGMFVFQDNNQRVVECSRSELGPAIPDVSGYVQVKGMPLVNAKVIVEQEGEPKQTIKTDSCGSYGFENLVSGKNFRVRIKGPVVP
jgi:hypothetical protein